MPTSDDQRTGPPRPEKDKHHAARVCGSYLG
jgi:hypothetical protein